MRRFHLMQNTLKTKCCNPYYIMRKVLKKWVVIKCRRAFRVALETFDIHKIVFFKETIDHIDKSVVILGGKERILPGIKKSHCLTSEGLSRTYQV